MSAIPSSGKQLVQWLRREGWRIERQRGGHVQVRHPSGALHTVALGMGGRDIYENISDLRKRGLVEPGSRLGRPIRSNEGDNAVAATIAEHIEAASAPAEQTQPEPAPNANRPINAAMQFIRDNSTVGDEELARRLGLTVSSIARYRRMLGVTSHARRNWTAEEDDLLRSEWGRSSLDDLCAILSRGSRSVIGRASRLGLGLGTSRVELVPTPATVTAPVQGYTAMRREEPTPAAPSPTPVADAGAGLVYRLRLGVGADGWIVAINGKAQPAMPGLVPAMVGAALVMAEQTMGYAVPAETKAALVKALRGG